MTTTTDTTPDLLWTVRETARALRLSGRQCYKLVSANRMPAPLRIGRAVRWRRSDIEAFLAAGADMSAYQAAQQREGGR